MLAVGNDADLGTAPFPVSPPPRLDPLSLTTALTTAWAALLAMTVTATATATATTRRHEYPASRQGRQKSDYNDRLDYSIQIHNNTLFQK